MKKIKKLMAMLLALTMVLGMSVTVFAAANPDGEVGTSDDRGDIVIQNVESGVTVELYKIVEATYDDNENFNGYATTDTAYETILKGDAEKVDYSALGNIDAETINSLGNAKVEGTKVRIDTPIYTTTQPATDTTRELGTYKCESLGVGMYLVVLSGAESTIYNYAVASIYYTVKDDDNFLVDGNTDGKALNIKDANIVAKATDHPKVTKSIKDEDNNKASGASVNIGDIVNYEVEINPVPYYAGENPVLNVTDVLSEGLTLDKESIKITAYKKGASTPTPLTAIKADTDTAQTIKVNFVGTDNTYLL